MQLFTVLFWKKRCENVAILRFRIDAKHCYCSSSSWENCCSPASVIIGVKCTSKKKVNLKCMSWTFRAVDCISKGEHYPYLVRRWNTTIPKCVCSLKREINIRKTWFARCFAPHEKSIECAESCVLKHRMRFSILFFSILYFSIHSIFIVGHKLAFDPSHCHKLVLSFALHLQQIHFKTCFFPLQEDNHSFEHCYHCSTGLQFDNLNHIERHDDMGKLLLLLLCAPKN